MTVSTSSRTWNLSLPPLLHECQASPFTLLGMPRARKLAIVMLMSCETALAGLGTAGA